MSSFLPTLPTLPLIINLLAVFLPALNLYFTYTNPVFTYTYAVIWDGQGVVKNLGNIYAKSVNLHTKYSFKTHRTNIHNTLNKHSKRIEYMFKVL